MNEEELKRELNKKKAHLRYYKEANFIIKKQNSYLRYENHLLKSKLKILERKEKENSYLIIELLKEKQ